MNRATSTNTIKSGAGSLGKTGATALNDAETHTNSGQKSSQNSAQLRALLQLREMILAGELPGGTRIAELSIVEKLGVSRTPIRAALMRLAQEGLLEALSSGGYAVRTFSERDVTDAIELRGTLEGLSARLAAERAAPALVLSEARDCLRQIDAVLGQLTLNDESFSSYVELNARFHALLSEMAGSSVMARELDRVISMPFASPSAFVVAQANSQEARDMLVVAQDQHWQVLSAIEQREGARAEAIMREHSRLAQRNLHKVLLGSHEPGSLNSASIPGVRLIRKRNTY